MIIKNKKYTSIINSINFIFLIPLLFFISVFYVSFSNIIGDTWAYNELFINYEFGLVRRGLLGSVYLKLFNSYQIEPLIFFSTFFILLYLINIFLFYKLIQKWKNSLIISCILILSPALLLYPVYEENVYFTRDVFIKISIFFHAFIAHIFILGRFEKISYNNCLRFFVIPLILITIFIHEIQIIFLSVHILITYTVLQSKKIKDVYKYYLYYLFVPISFIFLLIVSSGAAEHFQSLNDFLIKNFNVHIHPQLGKTIISSIGNFYKWHFYYFEYEDFINTFLSFVFSVYIIYIIFDYLINKEIIIVKNQIKKIYIFFYLPCFASFLLTDHGRTISFLANHLVAFYLIFDINQSKLNELKNKITKLFFIKHLLLFFLFFYILLWGLSHTAGLGVKAKKTSVFYSPMFSKIIYLTNNTYYFLKDNIFYNWPDIKKNL